jgi:hypothetical protein
MTTPASVHNLIRPKGSAVAIACLLLASMALLARNAVASPEAARPTTETVATSSKIPAGTLLPVVLDTSMSFEKVKPGQVVTGKIAQDVPLPDGSKIRRGSAVQGHVTEVVPSTNGPKLTIRFDRVRHDGAWVPVVTDLRAIAGFMAVQEAHVPLEAPGEGSPYEWLPTSQIGGDTVYGLRGPVMSGQNTSEVIGESVPNGVLAKISANDSCRGDIDNSNQRQALWVFSGDACGVYGIGHLKIDHAGRTDPQGSIVLAAENHNVKLNNGDGLLLRVD